VHSISNTNTGSQRKSVVTPTPTTLQTQLQSNQTGGLKETTVAGMNSRVLR
jgi:hypothetical protein